MLPDFNEHGYLPRGVHRADMVEVLSRFGVSSDLRREQAESLNWLISLCKSAGITRVIVNGSFVTDLAEPNDVDCVLLIGSAYNEFSEAAGDLERGLPFLSLQIVRQNAFDELLDFFGTDRSGTSKGVVEIIL